MKKFMAYVKVLAFLWMILIVAAIMLLLFPIFAILPESAKAQLNGKFEVFRDWVEDTLFDLELELMKG